MNKTEKIVLFTPIVILLLLALCHIMDWLGIVPDVKVGNTIYSKGYNEGLFNNIKVGDNIEMLENLMGKPLRKVDYNDGRILWCYSDSANWGSFEKRWVIVKNSLVIEIFNEPYYD